MNAEEILRKIQEMNRMAELFKSGVGEINRDDMSKVCAVLSEILTWIAAHDERRQRAMPPRFRRS